MVSNNLEKFWDSRSLQYAQNGRYWQRVGNQAAGVFLHPASAYSISQNGIHRSDVGITRRRRCPTASSSFKFFSLPFLILIGALSPPSHAILQYSKHYIISELTEG